jgi:DNA-binding protein HU-beta
VRKLEIINKVSSQTGIDKTDVQETIEATLITIKEALKEGKIARNISTNTAIILDAHYVPHFKPSKILVDLVKENNKIV